jgi:hypothetical protein
VVRDQLERLEGLFTFDEYLLVVMDCCRYDYFSQHCRGLYGYVDKVWSAATPTVAWFDTCLKRDLKDTLVISNHNGLSPNFTWSRGGLTYRASDYFGKVVKAQVPGGPDGMHPRHLHEAYRANCDWNKTVVWCLQPHKPYVTQPGLDTARACNALAESGKIDELRRAYTVNLKLGWEYVKRIVDRSPVRRVIVTADHGELLGEDGLFWHAGNVDHPVLREVPWMEIKK